MNFNGKRCTDGFTTKPSTRVSIITRTNTETDQLLHFTESLVEVDRTTRNLEYDPTGGRGFASPLGWEKQMSNNDAV